jgi:hypothetical protein
MTTTPRVNTARVERRDSGQWVVIYGGTVVGRHQAQYRAREQADALNTSEIDCPACEDRGYLVDQTYGAADIPEDWTPVQACDGCEIGRDMTDEQAAMCAANDRDDIDRRVYFAYFPGYGHGDDPDDGDPDEPGDWAIGPNL